jgi:UDP-N-acetyl-D-mannosaminuronic acid dehydrogenase/UDP-N-acetyl-D-glucosamine dehydrogenase
MRAVEVGHEVVGFDVNTSRVDLLASAGRSSTTCRTTTSPPRSAVAASRPRPTRRGWPGSTWRSSPSRPRCATARRICGHVEDAARILAPHVREGCSCPGVHDVPGIDRGDLHPAAGGRQRPDGGAGLPGGLQPGAHRPEQPDWGFRNTPKLVSGIDRESAEAVTGFYGELVDDVVPVPGTREAELAKLLENTFRHVNIALVNELAIFCNELGIDVWSVLDAAATKPFGFMRFDAGPGVGGHCLPIDPSYLSWQVRRSLGRTSGSWRSPTTSTTTCRTTSSPGSRPTSTPTRSR